jgi:membrane fusion protein, heavy metal efflux system
MKNLVMIMFSVSLTISCSKQQESETEITDTNVVTITDVQYKAARIKTGKIEKKYLTQAITVNGKLDVPPQNMVTIAAPMGGFVRSTHLLQGMPVKKGESLVTLENQDYIQLQQDYLDNKSKIQFLEAEYQRQESLFKENVNAQKTLQLARSQYESMKAVLSGLEAKLSMINITPAVLQEGKIRPSINLYSPISGFVTAVEVNTGQFVEATDVMFRIVNLDHVHAELQVYEQDINKIFIGQKVTFLLANNDKVYPASVYLVGKEISADRTVRVHCHLEKEEINLIPGMFVQASIETTAVEAEVVPSNSIVSYEGSDFVFAASPDNTFTAIPVNRGISTADFTEIRLITAGQKVDSIVTEGAFELLGLLKNKQE